MIISKRTEGKKSVQTLRVKNVPIRVISFSAMKLNHKELSKMASISVQVKCQIQYITMSSVEKQCITFLQLRLCIMIWCIYKIGTHESNFRQATST